MFEWLQDFIDNQKAFRALPSIASETGTVAPVSTIDFQTAYEKVEVINRCVTLIVNACVEVPLLVEGTNKRRDAAVSERLNRNPNPLIDRDRFYRGVFLDYLIDGNAFIHIDPDTGYFWHLPAERVSVAPHPVNFLEGYEYAGLAPNAPANPFGMDGETATIVFRPEEIIHLKADSNDNLFRGESRLQNLNKIIELYWAMTAFQRQFFQNNAIPGFVLRTSNVLSRKVKERLLAEWVQNYSTIFKSNRSPAILDGGLEVDKFSEVKFTELDFEQSIDRLHENMALGLGVPIGLLKTGNNVNTRQILQLFYTQTVLPILRQFGSTIGNRFNTHVKPDTQAVPALRRDNKEEAGYYATLVNGGLMTPNEARSSLKLPKVEGQDCDQIRIPQNITGSAVNPAEGGRPANDNI